MHTDCCYVVFSEKAWVAFGNPPPKEKYGATRHKWLPSKDPEHKKYDLRTPGLFHVEFEGTTIIALSPKTYYAEGPDPNDPEGLIIKMSTKGLPKRQNKFKKQDFLNVLSSGISMSGVVKNFRAYGG